MKIKFTATAVTETDKATIQALRKEYKLTEKEMMKVIIEVAGSNTQLLQELSEQAIASRVKRVRKTKTEAEPTAEVAEPTAEVLEEVAA